MVFDGSHLTFRARITSDRAPRRLGIPWVPAFLGVLAVLNVASVIMVLME